MTIIEQRQAFRIFDQIRIASSILDSSMLAQAQKIINTPSSGQSEFETVFPAIDDDKHKTAVNISASGMAFYSDSDLTKDTKMALTLQLDIELPLIYLIANVIKSEEKDSSQYLVFVHFTCMQPQAKEAINNHITKILDKQRKSKN